MDSAGTGDLKGLPISSQPMDVVDPYHIPAWYPIMSGEGFGNSCPVLTELANPHFQMKLENQAQFVQFPCMDDVVMPKIPSSCDGPSCHSTIPPIHGIGSSHGKKKRKNLEEEKQENTSDSPEKKGKEDYIHVRAKRGQATNSHSLAERMRRERISERMRLLQDLVPGCNKITGKAVMLDEIINYVQSLQQQVEFLSMKLATVNPELDPDIQQMLSKDMLQLRELGIGPGLSSSHLFADVPQEVIHSFPCMTMAPQFPFHPLSQSLWNSELQSILQTGLDSNQSSGGSPRMHGDCSKMEP